MSISRIFQSLQLAKNTDVTLDAAGSHHVARVLRAKIKDRLTLFNGQGGEFSGPILHIDKNYVTVHLDTFTPREAESALELYLIQGISRGEKMDYTIQKAVELGVKKIIPLFTERCSVKLDSARQEKRLQHWQSIIAGACEQSGRNQLPDLLPPQTLTQNWRSLSADWYFVLSPNAKLKLKDLPVQPAQRVVLLIGPEGGLTDTEIATVCEQDFITLQLGPRILRTETAAIAALTALQCYFGDMG